MLGVALLALWAISSRRGYLDFVIFSLPERTGQKKSPNSQAWSKPKRFQVQELGTCTLQRIFLGVGSPLFSILFLFKNQLFPKGFRWFFRKKDAWKEWKWKVNLRVSTQRKSISPPKRPTRSAKKWPANFQAPSSDLSRLSLGFSQNGPLCAGFQRETKRKQATNTGSPF